MICQNISTKKETQRQNIQGIAFFQKGFNKENAYSSITNQANDFYCPFYVDIEVFGKEE